MNREQERAKRRPEKNPVVEYNKIQNKYYPELFAKFAEVNDPRNQSYIEYPVRVMLGTMYYKCISGISSMQEMTLKFNDDAVVENLYSFMSEEKKEYLPHGVIENEFLARLNPEELEKIQKDIAYSMIRRKITYLLPRLSKADNGPYPDKELPQWQVPASSRSPPLPETESVVLSQICSFSTHDRWKSVKNPPWKTDKSCCLPDYRYTLLFFQKQSSP